MTGRECIGVFNKQTLWTLCSCFYELEFFGAKTRESWHSSLSQVLQPQSAVDVSPGQSKMTLSHARACIRLSEFIVKVSFLAICCWHIEVAEITSGRNSLNRALRSLTGLRGCLLQGFVYMSRRWCLDSCIQRHLPRVKVWWTDSPKHTDTHSSHSHRDLLVLNYCLLFNITEKWPLHRDVPQFSNI